MSATYSAGLMTAYGAAKDAGYTGTYAQFCQAMRDLAGIVASATTLPAGSSATAEYNGGTLSLGIPKGDKGDRGETGATGPTGATGQTGATGNGIASVTKTGTSGLVDTYTITFTDGNTTTFTVTNGEDGEVTQAQLDEVVDDLEDLKTAIGQITDTTEVETEIETIGTGAGLFINGQYNKFGHANESVFSCKYITVEKGKKYHITANPIKVLSTDYGYVAFSANVPVYDSALTVLVPAESTSSASVDYVYEATADGYLSVALHSSIATVLHFYEVDGVYHVTTDKTLLLSDVPADAKETGDRFALLEYGEAQKSDDIASTYTAVDRYITSQGAIALGGADRFTVSWYPVEKNNTYSIHGYGYVGGSGQALVCFDNVINSDRYHSVLEVLQTGTTTDTEYNISYTPAEDGYIVMSSVSSVRLLVTLVSEVDFQRIYDIEKDIEDIQTEIGRVPDAVKIQLFGDSITDNLWGDKTTWANFIAENMREYTVTVVNDAVGGSGIGHGKSSGTTESHQTEEYNYVYDLVTDGQTLQTDANVIVILVGTNNWASGAALGDMSSTGYSTVYGALKGILEYISQNTSAVTFVCTIPQRYNSADQSRTTNSYGEPLNPSGISLADYCEAFRQVSAFYGMPCVHLNEALGWNRLNVSKYCGDGLHPNVTGDKMLAKFICSEIKKHI